MSSDHKKMDCGRRRLIVATSVVGGLGAIAAVVPFVASMMPSERAKAAGAPVEVDIGSIPPGVMMIVEWRGKPVWVLNRTEEMLATLQPLDGKLADPDSNKDAMPLPGYCDKKTRSIKPNLLVVIGICTHLGCSPSQKFKKGTDEGMPADWPGGFLCPCHGSLFDLAARVYKGMPAPTNLDVPPHMYLSDTRIMIGEEKVGA